MSGKTKTVRLPLPAEFVQKCAADNTSPMEVLTGFINDLCRLEGNNGSDERDYAENYYYRCGYPYRRGADGTSSLTEGMRRDIALSWPLVAAQHKRSNS